MGAPTRRESTALSPSMTALCVVLGHIGWEVRNVDLDLVAGRATVEVHRHDGRWLYFSVDPLGRASIERWDRTIRLGRRAADKGGPQSPQIEDTFLGRTRCEGARSGLRSLCTYLADNPAPGFPQIAPATVRRALAPTMNEPATLDLRALASVSR